MDNIFTTLPLLDTLTDMGMYGVGTIRENRLQGAPLKKKVELQKETRRTFDYTSNGNNLLVPWRDNKVVIVVPNSLSLNPVSSTKRWSKAEENHVDIPISNPFKIIMQIWEVLIYLTSSCQLIVCESFPKIAGRLFLLGQ